MLRQFLSNRADNPVSGHLLWRAAKLWQQAVNDAVAPYGVTGTQAVLLAATIALRHKKIAATQHAVAVATHIDVVTVSQAIRTLVRKQLITREVCSDKRARELIPTPEGERKASSALAAIGQAHQQFFGALPLETQKQLNEALQQLVTN